MKRLKIIFLTSLFFTCAGLQAFDIFTVFLHSEIAGKNSVFADVGIAPFVFKELEFNVLPLDVRVEYMPPVPLPFSLGLFLKTPSPNFKSFGARLGYHFNIAALDRLTDLYVVYSYDFGFLRSGILEEHNDTPVPAHWYDFRFGARHFFRSRYGVAVETGFKFQDIIFLVSIKIY
jgi:hypothetical protein